MNDPFLLSCAVEELTRRNSLSVILSGLSGFERQSLLRITAKNLSNPVVALTSLHMLKHLISIFHLIVIVLKQL